MQLAGPHLGQIKGVERERFRLRIAHHLNEQGPPRETAGLDALEKVALVSLTILADERLGLGIRQIFDSLLGAKVKFDPDALIARVEETVGVAAEAMHVAKAARDSAIAHHDGDLVQGLRQQGPEVPIVIGAAHAGRVA